MLARALCHIDNAYWIPDIEVHGRVAKTNRASNTAFRGFGGPQGMIVIEDILGRCAPRLGLAPDELRRRNFYAPGQATPYGQPVRHAERLEAIWSTLTERSDFARRQAAVTAFNARTRTPSAAWPSPRSSSASRSTSPRSTRPARWCTSTRTARC